MIYTYQKPKTFTDSFISACFASMNAGAAFGCASMALGHFDTQICAELKDTSKTFGGTTTFCLPTAYTIKYSQKFDSFASQGLGTSFSPSFLDFSAGVAGILSVYFAKQSYRHFREVF